jgi:mannose-1-phosphate guanylyltransferase
MEISSVLFGAGQGKRLRPLTEALPKPALPLLDVPLGAWGLATLALVAGPVVVNGSHLADRLFEALDELGLDGWEPMIEGPEAYGTAGTLAALRDRAGPRVTTWNGDLLSSLAPEALHRTHGRLGRLGTIAVVQVDAGADVILESERVTGFVDRRIDRDVAGARFIGAAVFEKPALERLPSTRPAGLGETLLRDLAESGDLGAHVFDGYWNDVGTPDAYRRASLDLLYGLAPSPPVVLPGEVVEVAGGRVYLGPGAQAEPDALGAGAIVLRGARVEEGASVANAIVMPGETVPAGASVEQTIWFGSRPLP